MRNVRRHLTALSLSLALVAVNLLAWLWAHPGELAAQAQLPVSGLAYNGFQRWQSPLEQRYPDTQDLARDLQILSSLTSRVRTYSSAELPQLPALAEALGMKVTAGVWLDGRIESNDREVRAVMEAVHRHSCIERVIAGNETQLHGTLSQTELVTVLQRLRRQLKVPVSTAEPWHVWLSQPELVEAVDFIAVHLLPYWEGVPAEVAVHEVWRRHDELRARYPDKRLVIAEVGWPSAGPVIDKRVAGLHNRASASPGEQARFVREFVASAQRRPEPVEYFLMEAVDQPWKSATEGGAGPHWGVLDAQRRPKFEWRGPVQRNPHWPLQAAAAAVLGLLAAWPILVAFSHMRVAARLAYGLSAQVVASLVVVLGSLALTTYLQLIDALLLALLVPALLLMAAILLTQLLEFAELFWDGSLRRRARPQAWSGGACPPRVSIHLACSNEPPQMVLAAIQSLQALDWPALEIIVVDNNTDDPACWRPVRDYVDEQRRAGDRRLRFMRLPRWPGYKAGALNEALRATSSDAQWIAVVDADYVVRPDWISRVAGHFDRSDVAVIQCPQAHRAWRDDRLWRMMNWEYEGFFRLGMHHRHERNAIVQHGTMTLIRAQALRDVGGWAADTVCEDTELGLRLLRAGWRKVYIDEVMGTGLVPQDFAAYQRQRRRWAQGAMQILRRHASALLGRGGDSGGRLTLAQRYHFVAGWLPWVGDMLHLVFTLTALVWSVGVLLLPQRLSLPLLPFAVPLVVFFLARAVLVPLLYRRRVQCRWSDVAGAAWAGMALSHAIAVGGWTGLLGRSAVFHVTRKRAMGVAQPAPTQQRWGSVWPQALLLAALVGVGAALALEAAWMGGPSGLNGTVMAWLLILALQGLPYAAALWCALWPAVDRLQASGPVGSVRHAPQEGD